MHVTLVKAPSSAAIAIEISMDFSLSVSFLFVPYIHYATHQIRTRAAVKNGNHQKNHFKYYYAPSRPTHCTQIHSNSHACIAYLYVLMYAYISRFEMCTQTNTRKQTYTRRETERNRDDFPFNPFHG